MANRMAVHKRRYGPVVDDAESVVATSYGRLPFSVCLCVRLVTAPVAPVAASPPLAVAQLRRSKLPVVRRHEGPSPVLCSLVIERSKSRSRLVKLSTGLVYIASFGVILNRPLN